MSPPYLPICCITLPPYVNLHVPPLKTSNKYPFCVPGSFVERHEVFGIFHAKRVILRSSVYSLAIAREKGGNRDAQSQTAKRKELTNNQTKTPNGVKTFTFIAWEPPLACLAWKILITDGREVNKKGAFLKISFTSVFKNMSSGTSANHCFPLRRDYLFTFMVCHHLLKQAPETEGAQLS